MYWVVVAMVVYFGVFFFFFYFETGSNQSGLQLHIPYVTEYELLSPGLPASTYQVQGFTSLALFMNRIIMIKVVPSVTVVKMTSLNTLHGTLAL